jgi:hypothetical protein
MMLKWPEVLNLAKTSNPAPDRKVIKTAYGVTTPLLALNVGASAPLLYDTFTRGIQDR